MSFGSDILWGDIPTFVEFNLDQFGGPRWLAWNFVNASGWLQVVETTMATPVGQQSRTYAIGCNDEGVTLPNWEADFLIGLPTSHPMPTQHFVPGELSAIAEMARYDFMGECDGLALKTLEGLEEKTRSELQHLELRFDQVLTLASARLSALKSELRSIHLTADRKTWLRDQIELLESEESRAEVIFIQERQRVRDAAEVHETALIESLTYEADIEVLYTVQFEARMRGREKQIKWPLIEEEGVPAGWSRERAQEALRGHLSDAVTRRAEEASPVVPVEDPEKPAESSIFAWVRRAEQLERIAKTRRILSPKSKIALGKLKSGQTALSETDRNAMKHLIVQLKKTGFDVDGFLTVK